MISDLKYTLRQLAKHPGFTAVAVFSLALGIGATTAIFSLVDDQLLKSLPVKNPDNLIVFEWLSGPKGSQPNWGGFNAGVDDTDLATGKRTSRIFSRHTFEAFRDEHTTLTDVFAVGGLWGINVNVDNQAEIVGFGELVSGNYFGALGVTAIRGRTLLPEDDKPGAEPAAVISYRYWRARFASDPGVVGKTILMNRVPVVIVGITPPDFQGTMRDAGMADITVPLAMAAPLLPDNPDTTRPAWWLRLMGRLKPGVTVEQAGASLQSTFQASAREGWSNLNDLPSLRVVPGGKGRTEADLRQEGGIMLLMLGMAGLLLLTACANVANLLLARGGARRREIAVRMALGASRGRIIRQLLVESVSLALLGAGLGLLFSEWGLELISMLLPPLVRQFLDLNLALNLPVLSFTTGVALLTGIGFGLAPALRTTHLNLTAEFQGGMRNLGGEARSVLSRLLMIAQVAFSLILLVTGGLFIRTLHNLQAVDLGFNRTHLLLFSLDGTSAGYKAGQLTSLDERISDRVGALPGVRSVTFAGWPFASGNSGYVGGFYPEPTVPPGKWIHVAWNGVETNFFETYGVRLLLGRGFAPKDNATGQKVAVVNQALVEKYLAGKDPIGRHVNFHGVREIVGVVRDVQQTDLRQSTPPTVFIPFSQSAITEANFVVRTAGDPKAMVVSLRQAVAGIDRNIPLVNVRTMDEQIEQDLTLERMFASLSTGLGVLALALACVGLYGLMSYAVLRRTSEIGIRMALGALPGRVLRMILRESLVLVGTGVVIGLVAAAAATRLMSHLLFGLSPTDPLTFAGGALLLIVVAALACLIPARRAARVDPVVALRAE